MQSRTAWIDYAKAIGICLVVYGHVAGGVYNAGINIPADMHILVHSIIYSFHMPLFFFLSGLFFWHSFQKHGGSRLVLSKIDTIVYPYIIWSILQGSAQAFLSSYANGKTTYSDVFSLLWAPQMQFWFLYALFAIFCLSVTLYSILSRKSVLPVLAVSAIIYIYQDALPDNLIIGFIANNFIFFAFGMAFSLYCKIEKFSSWSPLLFLTIGVVIGQFVFHEILSLRYQNTGVASLILALTSILFIVSLSSRMALKPNKFIILVGTSSMAIYLMHGLGSGVRIILKNLFGVESFEVYLIVGFLVGVLGPMLALVFIRKAKMPYLFSAPISKLILIPYQKIFK